jgi:hypothetical protein
MSPASRREEGGSGCLTGAGRRRRYRGKATEAEERDTTPDLLLKHSDTTLTTYV